MKAIVTKAFPGVKDGEVYPVDFKPGDEVEGDLGRVAVAEGWAEEIKDKGSAVHNTEVYSEIPPPVDPTVPAGDLTEPPAATGKKSKAKKTPAPAPAGA